MFQYNKLFDFQYARFQILVVHIHFGLFWSGGIPTLLKTRPPPFWTVLVTWYPHFAKDQAISGRQGTTNSFCSAFSTEGKINRTDKQCLRGRWFHSYLQQSRHYNIQTATNPAKSCMTWKDLCGVKCEGTLAILDEYLLHMSPYSPLSLLYFKCSLLPGCQYQLSNTRPSSYPLIHFILRKLGLPSCHGNGTISMQYDLTCHMWVSRGVRFRGRRAPPGSPCVESVHR